MRKLFWAGLTLALGCLAARSGAEELQFRPVGQAAPGQPALNAAAQPAASTSSETTPLFRAKTEDPKTLPDGPPPLPTEPVNVPGGATPTPEPQKIPPKNEEMPPPKPLPSGNGPGTTVVIPGGPPVYYNGKIVAETAPPEVIGDPSHFGDPGLNPDWSCGTCATCGHGGWFDCNCCPMPRIYGSAEFLLWGISHDHTPTLVTGTTLSPTDLVLLGQARAAAGLPFNPGAIGEVGTVPLIGGSIDTPTLMGGRFTLGFGDLFNHNFGLEATAFFLGNTSKHTSVSSDATGLPPIFSPFFLPNGMAVARDIAFPTLLAGSATVSQTSRMWGIEANIRKPIFCDCDQKLDFLGGFRFIELVESLSIARTSVCIEPGCAGDLDTITDNFGTRNRFYGGQVGFDYQYKMNRWIFGVNGKVAIGDMHQTIETNGLTVATPGANAVPGPVGLLVQGSNTGRFTQDRFAVVPEVGLKIGYQVTENVTVFAGYSAMYLSNVVRPGEQIDLVVDPSGKLARPHIPFHTNSFWASGFNAGVECRW